MANLHGYDVTIENGKLQVFVNVGPLQIVIEEETSQGMIAISAFHWAEDDDGGETQVIVAVPIIPGYRTNRGGRGHRRSR
jgi:hypothetical protein